MIKNARIRDWHTERPAEKSKEQLNIWKNYI